MALLHRAELRPTKLELLAAWLPRRPWYRGPAAPRLTRVGSYRFDDPDGEVGLETLIVHAGDGWLMQVPLTYRATPLDGRDRFLVGSAEHSVLGRRYIYDACGDPVYASVLAAIMATGAGQAEELIDIDGRLERLEPTVRVSGSGGRAVDPPSIDALDRVDDSDPTLVVAGPVELAVVRVLGDGQAAADERWPTLTGTWPDRPDPVLLAYARA
jgi:Maltokinase N-terminal cap domain